LRRLGREEEARAAYARALELSETGAERRFLESRLTDLGGGESADPSADHGADPAVGRDAW
jgi:hypothetical protein